MSHCVLIKVIDREIYTYWFDNVDDAWNRVVKEFNEFVSNCNLVLGEDCDIQENRYTAWANGAFECVDWVVELVP